MTKRIYLDNAATTPMCPEAIDAMTQCMREIFGNPSSVYKEGAIARQSIEDARKTIADCLNASPDEIYFTSGGTESDNWALKGIYSAYKKQHPTSTPHIITTKIEHHAILHTAQFLEEQGASVTYLPVDQYGMVNTEDVERAITPDTILISVMTANNEIGTIQPIEEISEIARKYHIPFHTDAVQAVGYHFVDVDNIGVDLLSLSAHKFHGPKGVGALYIRKDTPIAPFMHGGAQEKALRASTQNVPAIVGMAAALKKATSNQLETAIRINSLRNKLVLGILNNIPRVHLNGHPIIRLHGNANFSFEGVNSESLVLMLDLKGISASSGSACTTGSLDPSHVLTAIGLTPEQANSSVRFSLSDTTTEQEIDTVLQTLSELVAQLRSVG